MSVNSLKLENNYIALSQDISDLKGVLWKNLEVLPNTKVIVYENGKNLGELAPGLYTLETFRDHFRFLTTKSIKMYVLRNQDFEISYRSPSFLCKEGLALDGEIRVRFALKNGNLFLNNLLGSRSEYKVYDFTSDTQAIIMAALQEGLCQFSIKELNLPETRKYLETVVEKTAQESLSRYGIEFRSLTIAYLKHEKYDKIRDEKNAVWLAGEQLEVQKAQDKVDLDARLAEITKTEEENNLDVLAKQVFLDHEEGKLAVLSRRYALKQELREQVQADKFNEIKTEEEMKQFLFQTDKATLLRDEEREELTAAIRGRLTDSDLRREAVLEKLTMQLDQEKKLIAQAYLHECKMKAVEQEIELARKVATQENEAWLRQLEKERAERKETLARLVDEKEIARAVGELQFEEEQSKNRIAMLRCEREATENEHELEMNRKSAELEEEIRNKKFTNRLEQMQAMESIRHMRRSNKMDLYERKQRIDANNRMMEETARQKFELDRLRLLSTFGEHSILALLNPDQAKAYAETARNRIDEATSEALIREKDKAKDEIKEMFQNFMDMQERNADRMVQMHSQTPYFTPTAFSQSVFQQPEIGGVPTQSGVLRCPHCKSVVSVTNKFCPNCGKEL